MRLEAIDTPRRHTSWALLPLPQRLLAQAGGDKTEEKEDDHGEQSGHRDEAGRDGKGREADAELEPQRGRQARVYPDEPAEA